MRVLVLGGTVFLGRHVVEEGLALGHEITIFNRGRTNSDLFPEIERITGDRDHVAGLFDGREWDAVVDCSGYIPRHVAESAAELSGRASHYTFVSSISVYADISRRGIDEGAPVIELEEPDVEEVTPATYGGLKVLCERAAVEAFDGPVLNLRAGLIIGPYDPTHRFPYWTDRVARGGEVLVPGDPDRRVQLIDARDIARWIFMMAADAVSGPYNVTGPATPLGFGSCLDRVRSIVYPEAELTWVDSDFLIAEDVRPWHDIPFWVTGDAQGLMEIDIDRALDRGLECRPLERTVADLHSWYQDVERPADRPGLDPARERELLALWRAAQVGAAPG